MHYMLYLANNELYALLLWDLLWLLGHSARSIRKRRRSVCCTSCSNVGVSVSQLAAAYFLASALFEHSCFRLIRARVLKASCWPT